MVRPGSRGRSRYGGARTGGVQQGSRGLARHGQVRCVTVWFGSHGLAKHGQVRKGMAVKASSGQAWSGRAGYAPFRNGKAVEVRLGNVRQGEAVVVWRGLARLG